MKSGRNDPCPCGSGRKYKRCCYMRETPSAGAELDLDFDEIMDDEIADGSELPGWKFIATLPQHELWNLIPPALLSGGLKLFGSGRYDLFDAVPTDGKGIEVSLSFVDGPTAIFLEPRKNGPIRSACNCGAATQKGICSHQICLLIILWHVLNCAADREAALKELSASTQRTIREFERIFSSARNGNRPNTSPLLESIILCFPVIQTVQGDSQAFPLAEVAEKFNLELKRLPQAADLSRMRFQPRMTVVPPGERDYDLFPYLLVTRPDRRGLENHQNRYGYSRFRVMEDQLRKSLCYRFADGVELTAQELLFHPYGKGVLTELLPKSDHVKKGFPSERLPRLVGFREGQMFGETNQILAQVAILAHKNKIPVYVTDSFSELNRKAILLTGIESQPIGELVCSIDLSHQPFPLECRWHLATLNPKVGSASENEKPYIFSNFAILPNGVLFFHRWDDSLSSALFYLGASIRPLPQSLPTPSPFSPFSMTFGFECREDTSLSSTLKYIRKSFHAHGASRLEILPASVTIAAHAIVPQIDIKSDGTFSSALSVRAGAGPPLGSIELSELYPFLLLIFEKGLGGVSWEDNTKIATQRKGTKRNRELKILRHQGLGHAIFQEVARGVLNGVNENVALACINEKAGLLVQKLEFEEAAATAPDSSKAPRLSQLCSDRVWELIQDFVHRCYCGVEEDQLPTFSPRGEEVLLGTFRRSLELFLAWSEQLAEDSNGSVFLKSKVPLFAVSPVMDKTFPVRAFLPLREKGFELTLDGSPIETLNPGDFRPEFTLRDATQSGESKKIDWFELCPRFFFKGVEITSKDAQRITADGVITFEGKLYLLRTRNLPSLKRLQNFWSRLQNNTGAARDGGMSALVYQLPKNQTLEMLALRASGVEVNGGPRWTEICEFYDRLGESREEQQLGPTIHATLMPFQQRGVRWLLDLYRLGLGGILADEMGLGKTLQTLAFLETLRCTDQLGHVLIVVPTSLTFNWSSESAKFTPNLPLTLFQLREKTKLSSLLAEKSQMVVLCTYGLLAEHQDFFASHPWNIQVFDEAQNLKNITAKRTSASRAVAARFKLCLTGTPLENHLGEFYSLMDLLVPGSLGELDSFRKKFVLRETLDREDIQALRLTVKPLIMRRTKSEILTELPEKTESTVKLVFDEKQKRIYRDVAVAWNEKVQEMIRDNGEGRSQLQMLTALLRLRQICSDPGSVPNVKYDGIPPKLSVLLDSLQEITESGDSALVFTQFLHSFERIRKALTDAKIPHFTLHGAHSRREREQSLKGFEDEKAGSVMLMTLKTGGVGLNLTKASYVFHLEPWWNPAVENQATDRAHRMGQEKSVQVFRYLMRDSVEEKIEILKQKKSARFNALFASEENTSLINAGGAHLSKEDFDFLLSQH